MKQLFSIRAATENDVDSLVELERESWTESMRHPFDQMMERIKTHIPKIFVLEMDKQVVGSICAQRIQDEEGRRVPATVAHETHRMRARLQQNCSPEPAGQSRNR